MNYILTGIGGFLLGIGLSSGSQTTLICGTIFFCSGFIVLAIQQSKR